MKKETRQKLIGIFMGLWGAAILLVTPMSARAAIIGSAFYMDSVNPGAIAYLGSDNFYPFFFVFSYDDAGVTSAQTIGLFTDTTCTNASPNQTASTIISLNQDESTGLNETFAQGFMLFNGTTTVDSLKVELDSPGPVPVATYCIALGDPGNANTDWLLNLQEPPIGTSTPTSTPESLQLQDNQLQTNLFYGFILFAISAGFLISLFKFKNK